MATFYLIRHGQPGEIVECIYKKGQSACEYSFC